MKRIIAKVITCLFACCISPLCNAQDIIVTTDAQKIDAQILEVSKTEIRYKEKDYPEGPTFILEIEDINSIIYANGKVVLYNQADKVQSRNDIIDTETTSSEDKTINENQQSISQQVQNQHLNEQKSLTSTSVSTVAQKTTEESKPDLSLARVECFSGVYVFTDCTPLSHYEVLGDVYFDKRGAQHASTLYTYNATSNTINSTAFTYTETPQYTDIRNGLIAQAIMANRQVEGIIITLPKEGEGRATLIKFEDGEDKSLAKVNHHLGIYVFTDCLPINPYSFVGKTSKGAGINVDYNVIRDKLITKAKSSYPTMQGIIPRFVTGSRDTAEAIRF